MIEAALPKLKSRYYHKSVSLAFSPLKVKTRDWPGLNVVPGGMLVA